MQPRIKLKRNPKSNNKDHIKNYICSDLSAKVLPSLLVTKGNNAPKENWKTKGTQPKTKHESQQTTKKDTKKQNKKEKLSKESQNMK